MCWDQRILELTLGSGILTSKNDFGYKTHMNRVLLFRPHLYKYRKNPPIAELEGKCPQPAAALFYVLPCHHSLQWLHSAYQKLADM